MHFQEHIHTQQKCQNHTRINPRISHHLAETALRFCQPLQPVPLCQFQVSCMLVLEAPEAGKYAKILSAEQDERLKVDYDVLYSPDEEDARECASDAREFLSAIKNYLKEQGINLDIQERS